MLRKIARHSVHILRARKEHRRLEAAAYFLIIVLEFWAAAFEAGLPQYIYHAVVLTPAHQHERTIDAGFTQL